MKHLLSCIVLCLLLIVSCDVIEKNDETPSTDTVDIRVPVDTVEHVVNYDTLTSKSFYDLYAKGERDFKHKAFIGTIFCAKMEGLTFDSCYFSSGKENPKNYIMGLYGKGVKDITVKNSRFEHIELALCLIGDGLKVDGNVFDYFTHDAIRAIGNNVQITGNTVTHPLNVSEHHRDGIQFYNPGTISNILIANNEISNKKSELFPSLYDDYFQGIVSFDGAVDNIVIRDNKISVPHWHGIAMNNIKNGEIYDNDLSGSNEETWIQVIKDPEGIVYIEGNEVGNLAAKSGDLKPTNNIIFDYKSK